MVTLHEIRALPTAVLWHRKMFLCQRNESNNGRHNTQLMGHSGGSLVPCSDILLLSGLRWWQMVHLSPLASSRSMDRRTCPLRRRMGFSMGPYWDQGHPWRERTYSRYHFRVLHWWEHFWWTAKREYIYLNQENNVVALRCGIAGFIDYYNNRRSHQGIGHKIPAHVHAMAA